MSVGLSVLYISSLVHILDSTYMQHYLILVFILHGLPWWLLWVYLFCIYVHVYHILDFTYMQYYMILVFILPTSVSMIMSRSIPVAANGIISFFNTMKVKVSVAQSCLNWTGSQSTLCKHMDCSLPGSSVHGILQARILEWVAIPFSRRSSQARDRTQVSCTGKWILNHWATREAKRKP